MTTDGSPRLTTHVLDTTRGCPAAGLAVTLVALDEVDAPTVVVVTNADGRTDAPLLSGAALSPGRYELTFAVGAYFAGLGGPATGEAYLDDVPVRFTVTPATGSVHVALLVTPWSYTTYRGS